MFEFQERPSKLDFSEKYIKMGEHFWISSLARLFMELNREKEHCQLLIIKKILR